MTETRIWLDVPFGEKDAAKQQGARWDAEARRWYAPRADMTGLAPWAPQPELPAVLPGEDRSFGSGLFVDLIPKSCWFSNVRTCIADKDWERLRRLVVNRAGHRCEACGQGENRDVKRWLEAHERWEYEDTTQVQRLKRIVCLCTDCHTTTHFGLARIKGLDGQARAHLRSVTGMSERDTADHIDAAFAVWIDRSAREWTLDLSILIDAGITLAPPPDAAARVTTAESALREARVADRRTPR
jgi:hypothetical protein